MSSWFDLRYRSGDILSARIRDLIQKQIDAQSEVTDVTDEQVIQPIIPLASKTVWRDHLFRVKRRDVIAGQISKLPKDPDGKELRFWVYNQHGGRYLTDRSFQGNLAELEGSDQSKLMDNTDDDGISNTRNVNWLVGDQHIRVHDNPNVQLKNIHTTEKGFTIFLRVFIPFLNNNTQYGRNGVIFSKLDDEQVKFGYVCQINEQGDVFFIVRDDSREYSITAIDLFPDVVNNLIPDFNPLDFNSLDYLTIATLEGLVPDIIPYLDLAFTYEFATHRMQIIKNGIIFKDSEYQPSDLGLLGWWMVNEGTGTVITDYSPNKVNGTRVNGSWGIDRALTFQSLNTYITIPSTGSGYNTLTKNFSFACWAFITAGEGPYAGLINNINGKTNGNRFLINPVSSSSTTILWQAIDSGGGTQNSSVTPAVGVLNGWHHFAVTYDGTNVRIYLDGVIRLTDPKTYTMGAGSDLMKLGWGSSSIYHLTGQLKQAGLWSRTLSDAEILTMFNKGISESTNLMGNWKLVEGGDIGNLVINPTSYAKTAFNSVELGNNGTITGATWSTITDKPHETYLDFLGGTGKYVLVPQYSSINDFTTGGLTISLWYRPESIPAQGLFHFLVVKNWAAFNSFIVYVDNPSGTPRIVVAAKDGSTTGSAAFNNSFAAGLNQWYHIVMRWKGPGTTVDAFVNNVKLVGSTLAGTILSSTTNLVFGHSGTSAPDGMIHDVKIWNRGLLDADITTLYNSGHSHTGFPKWMTDPPPPPEIPVPITNPFVLQYDLPKPASAFQWLKLHKLVASGFTQVYTKEDGVTIPEVTIPFSTVYEVTDASGGLVSGGGGGSEETVYDKAVVAGNHLEFEGGISRAGIRFDSGNAHIGKKVTFVTVRYRRQGSPSGTASVVIRKGTDDSIARTLGTFSVASGSGELEANINDQANTYVMAANDIVSVEYPTGSNTIELTYADAAVTGFTSLDYDGAWGTFNDGGLANLAMVIKVTPTGGGGGGGTGYPVYNISGRSGGTDCNFGNWIWTDISHIGAHITGSTARMYNKKLTRITVKLSKVGNPPGSIEIATRDGDVNGTKIIWGTVSAATLTTTPTDYTFTKLDNTYTMTTNSSVSFWANTIGGDPDNYFVVSSSGTSVEAGVQVRYRIHNPNKLCFPNGNVFVLTNNTTQDITGKFESGGQITPQKLHYYDLNGGAVREVGEVLISSSSVLNGKKVTRVKPKLKAVGNPVGTIRCIIRNSSGTEVSQVGSIEANTVSPTAFEEKEFTNLLQGITLGSGHKIMIQYTGTATDYIQMMVKHDDGEAVGGERVQTLSSGGSFTDVDADISGTIFVGGTATDPDAYERVGEKADLTDSKLKLKKISKVLVWLRKVGSPPNKVFLRVRKQSNDSTVANIGEINTSTIADSTITPAGQQHTFISTPVSVYAIQLDDTILVEYPDGDDNNYVEVAVTTTDAIDSNKSILAGYDALFTNYDLVATKDLIATMYSGGDTYTPTGDEIPPPPPPAYTHDLYLFAGGYPYTYWTTTNTTENWVGAIAPDIRWYRKILTQNELLNLYQNRRDRSNLPKGQVAIVGYFSLPASV